jgi:hypothetical protein
MPITPAWPLHDRAASVIDQPDRSDKGHSHKEVDRSMIGFRQLALGLVIVTAGSGGSMALTASNVVSDTTVG